MDHLSVNLSQPFDVDLKQQQQLTNETFNHESDSMYEFDAKRIKLEHQDQKDCLEANMLGEVNGNCQRCCVMSSNSHFSSFFMPTVRSDMVLRVFHDVEQQYKPIYVHRFVLSDRSSYFRQVLADFKDQTGTIVLELNSYRFSVYMVYLQYIYTSYLDMSTELLFELYQLVSDLDADNESLIRLVKNFQRNVELNELVNLYLFYKEHGTELYPRYDHCKMREFFEDFIWLSLNTDNYDRLLNLLCGTPIVNRILDFQKNLEEALYNSETVLEGLYYTQDLNNWPLLKQVSPALFYTVDRIFVFNSGQSLLMITRDDRVFALGANEHGQLGVGHQYYVPMAEEVVELNGRKVTSMHSGSGHMMALTESGDLYGFGRNHKGQVGVGTRDDQLKPALIIKNVRLVCCGDDHTVALDLDHNVWNWGSTAHGKTVFNFSKGDDPTRPIKIRRFMYEGKKVAYVHCGKQNSVAVTTEQQIFLWGEFGDGFSTVKFVNPELTTDYSRPSFKVVSAISFGENLLALSNNGVVYLLKFYGKFTFKPITNIKERVVSMHSPPERSSFAIFVGRSGQLYVLRHSNNSVAQIIWQISLVDSFHKEGKPITPHLAQLPQFLLAPNREELIESFNKPASSDLTFTVNDKMIYLHRSVIEKRFTQLPELFSSTWNDLKSIVLLYKSPPHSVYLHYFRYLYTQTLSHVDHRDLSTIFGLYSIAKLHYDNKLETRCENFILKILASTSANELAESSWLADNLAIIQNFLTAKLSNFFNLKQTMEMYAGIPELRDALIPSIINHESCLSTNSTYKQMKPNVRNEMLNKIAKFKESIEYIQLDS